MKMSQAALDELNAVRLRVLENLPCSSCQKLAKDHTTQELKACVDKAYLER